MGAFDFLGDLFNRSARDRAARAQGRAVDVYGDLNTEINPEQTAQSGLSSVDPATRAAQMAALNQLAGIGAQGGMDPGSKAALQQAQMSNAQQAKSSTDAALERARAENRLNSGRALSAQTQAIQGAGNANAMAGTQAAADARTRAMQALATTGQLGGSIRGQDFQAANAQDQINQFNAQMRQNAAQQSFNNQYNRAGGIAQNEQLRAGTDLGRAQQARESAGAIGDAVVTGATAGLTGGLSLLGKGAGSVVNNGNAAAQDTAGSLAIQGIARGGVIEGSAKHPGDSEKNDTVPAMLSPGEIVIPRSVAAEGPDAVRHFVAGLFHGRK